jgi:hypothetical protein
MSDKIDFNELGRDLDNLIQPMNGDQKLAAFNRAKEENNISLNRIRNSLDAYVNAYVDFREHLCNQYNDPNNPEVSQNIRDRFNRGYDNLMNIRNEVRNLRSDNCITQTKVVCVEVDIVNKLHIKINHIQNYMRNNPQYERVDFDRFNPEARNVVRELEEIKGQA